MAYNEISHLIIESLYMRTNQWVKSCTLRNKFFITATFGLFICLFALIAPTQAVGESVSIDAFDINNCTVGANADGTVSHENGTETVSIRFTLDNNTKSTSESWVAGILGSGTHTYSVPVPASTVIGDQMTMKIDLLDGSGGVLVSDTLTYHCGVIVPELEPEPEVEAEPEVILSPQPAFYDGRINDFDTAAPIAIYPHMVDGEVGLIIYNADGMLLMVVSPQQIADALPNPESNILISEANGVALYRLTNGDWQINAPQYNGKTYIIIFPELPHNGVYESFELDN